MPISNLFLLLNYTTLYILGHLNACLMSSVFCFSFLIFYLVESLTNILEVHFVKDRLSRHV